MTIHHIYDGDKKFKISRHELNINEFVKEHVGDLVENFITHSYVSEAWYDSDTGITEFTGLPVGDITCKDIYKTTDKTIYMLFNMMTVLYPGTEVADDLFRVSIEFKHLLYGGEKVYGKGYRKPIAILDQFEGALRDLWEWADIYDVKLN